MSHHPSCQTFDDDVYHVRGRRLCIGCFTSYPIAIFIVCLWLFGFISMPIRDYFILGFFSGMVQFASASRLSDKRPVKIAIKVFLGLGMGFFTIGVFSIPIHIILRILLFFILVQVTGLFSFFRMKKFESICRDCEYYGSWEKCPGFKDDL